MKAAPFVIYSLYTPRFPAVLFGKGPMWDVDDKRTLPGSALLVSAGQYREDPSTGQVLARPFGMLNSGVEHFVEQVVATLLQPDDQVRIVIDKTVLAPGRRNNILCQLDGAEVFDARDTMTILATGAQMGKIRWLDGVLGGSQTYVIASRMGSSALETHIDELARASQDTDGAAGAVVSFWNRFVEDPESAISMLGDYELFAYTGAFDPEDVIIQLRTVVIERVCQVLHNVATALGLALYEAPGPATVEDTVWELDFDDPSRWQLMPSDLRRVV